MQLSDKIGSCTCLENKLIELTGELGTLRRKAGKAGGGGDSKKQVLSWRMGSMLAAGNSTEDIMRMRDARLLWALP